MFEIFYFPILQLFLKLFFPFRLTSVSRCLWYALSNKFSTFYNIFTHACRQLMASMVAFNLNFCLVSKFNTLSVRSFFIFLKHGRAYLHLLTYIFVTFTRSRFLGKVIRWQSFFWTNDRWIYDVDSSVTLFII